MVLANVVSFVGQLDNHAPYLTVRETFDFAFQCRTGGKHANVGAHGASRCVNAAGRSQIRCPDGAGRARWRGQPFDRPL